MRRVLGILLTAVLLALPTRPTFADSAQPFSDLSGHWSEGVVRQAMAQGWAAGDPDGRFQPDAPLTRAEFVAMLVAALGRNPVPGSVTEPDRTIARTEIAVMLVRAMGREAEGEFRDGYDLPFPDAAETRGYLEVAYTEGMITGFPDGTFRPAETATRAQAVVMIFRMLGVSRRVRDPLTAGSQWETQKLDAICGTPDTRSLRVSVQTNGPGNYYGSPLKPGSGVLKVVVHNNTNICGGVGSPITIAADDISLRLAPYGGDLLPVAEVALPSLPEVLQPGEQVAVNVTMDGWLPPGRYLAEVVGTLQGYNQTGERIEPRLPGYWEDPKGATRLVMVTDGPLSDGSSTASTRPVPLVGGLGLPLDGVSWGGGRRTEVRVNAPMICGPGIDRFVRLDHVQVIALGSGFATPLLVSADNPVWGQTAWGAWTAPGETTSLLIRADARVLNCNGDRIAGTEVVWQVETAPR